MVTGLGIVRAKGAPQITVAEGVHGETEVEAKFVPEAQAGTVLVCPEVASV